MDPNASQLMRSVPGAVGGFLGTALSLLLLEFTHHSTFFSYSPPRFNLVKSAILRLYQYTHIPVSLGEKHNALAEYTGLNIVHIREY